MERLSTIFLKLAMCPSFLLLMLSYILHGTLAQERQCSQESIRLQGGTITSGRVEVCYNNIWGTVCDDQWENTDAQVACRHLGLSPTGATKLTGFAVPDGTGQIWLDNVNCVGTEDSLFNCNVKPIGSHNCDHSEDAGVRCQALDSTIRPPTSIMVNDTTSSGVTVQWIFLGPFNDIQKETCVLMYGTTSGQLDNKTSGITADKEHQIYSILLNSLAPATDYHYAILCTNSLDSSGISSTEMSFRTSDSKSGPVRELVTRSTSDSTLEIFWSPPTKPNGIIISFLIKINDLRVLRTVTNNMTSDGEVTNYEANALVAGIPYNVSVAAMNMAGRGILSFTVIFTQELAPSIPPKNIIVTRLTRSMMTVSWSRLTLFEARGFITHYTVAYFPSSGGRKLQEPNILYQTVSKNSSNTTIKGLDGSTVYAVQVSASTGDRAGVYSGRVIASIPSSGEIGFGVGTFTGMAVVAVVAFIANVIFILIILKQRINIYKIRRTLATHKDTSTCNTVNIHEHGEIEEDQGASNYETPVAGMATLSKQLQENEVHPFPAYGNVSNSPSLGEYGGQEDVEAIPSEVNQSPIYGNITNSSSFSLGKGQDFEGIPSDGIYNLLKY